MKDENGIEIECENCKHCEYCDDKFYPDSGNSCGFLPSVKAYEARIAELQKELFTRDELNLIRNTFQELIWEDDECDWSAEKKIIAKCDELLQGDTK